MMLHIISKARSTIAREGFGVFVDKAAYCIWRRAVKEYFLIAQLLKYGLKYTRLLRYEQFHKAQGKREHHRDAMSVRISFAIKKQSNPFVCRQLNHADLKVQIEDFYDASQEELSACICTLDIDLIGSLAWFFRYYGRLDVARFMRSVWREQLILEQNNLGYVRKQALQAALELGRLNWIVDQIKGKKIRTSDAEVVNEMLSFVYCLLGERHLCQKIRTTLPKLGDDLMRETLQGLKVAVVGPAPVSPEAEQEIREYAATARPNIVIKTNDHANNSMLLSYYNRGTVCGRSQEVIQTLGYLHVASFKSDRDLDLVGRNVKAQPLLRVMRQPNRLMLNDYGPNQVQNMLYDLMWFDPQEVKLFGTSFYASEVAYREGYSDKPFDRAKLSFALRTHEPFSNFNFVKNLYNFSLIEVDEATGAVLNKSEEEYADLMNKLYGDFTV